MNQALTTVQTKATGNRWYITYKINGKWHKEAGGVNRIKDPVKKLEELNRMAKEKELELNSSSYANITVPQAIDKLVLSKKLFQKRRSNNGMRKNLTRFKDFLVKTNQDKLKPAEITRSMVLDFINNELERGCENRTVNNYMIDLKAFFNHLITNEILLKSPCKGVHKLPERSEKNVAYTTNEVKEMKEWLDENDRYLQLFCKFITYTFLRIEEIQNLKVKDIDITKMYIYVPATGTKTSMRQTKKIMKPLQPVAKEMLNGTFDPDHYLFTVKGAPGPVRTGANFFNKRFKKLKDANNYSIKHTMYGLRHTFVINLLENGASPFEIMTLTGHSTLSAFEKYIRDLKLQLPKDISHKFTIQI